MRDRPRTPYGHGGIDRVVLAVGRSILLAASFGCSLAGPAHAGRETDIATGRQLAVDHCSRCHGIDDEGFTLIQGALPLREMKRRYPQQYLAEALAKGRFEAHPEVPAFAFSSDEIAALMVYLDSIW
jgi:mono/diheme cytochrome c family protein